MFSYPVFLLAMIKPVRSGSTPMVLVQVIPFWKSYKIFLTKVTRLELLHCDYMTVCLACFIFLCFFNVISFLKLHSHLSHLNLLLAGPLGVVLSFLQFLPLRHCQAFWNATSGLHHFCPVGADRHSSQNLQNFSFLLTLGWSLLLTFELHARRALHSPSTCSFNNGLGIYRNHICNACIFQLP